MAEQFAGFLTDAQRLAQAQLVAGQGALAAREAGVAGSVGLELQTAAATQQQAANTMLEAAEMIRQAIAGGGRVGFNPNEFAGAQFFSEVNGGFAFTRVI